MRKIREVLRLSLGAGLSRRQVGAAVGLPYTTVADHLGRARAAGLGWPLPDGMDDAALEARLFPSAAGAPPRPARPLPDWAAVHRELRRKGVTLQLLWLEYRERHPDGYQYTQFCDLYRRWQRRLDVVLRQEHRAGERLFVDFPGQTVPVVDADTGGVLEAEIFVAVLGASSYTYAEAFPSQALPHWIAGHVHAFEYYRGCPRLLVCDNLRAGVTRAHRYAPEVNRTYQELAAHYGCAVLPARPFKPRDKAKVEAGVLLVERWILARLRQRTFGSLAELNAAIRELLDVLNARPFKKVPGSRRSLFEDLERPALRPLPAHRFEFATWQTATVPPDYHLAVDRHWYSVPARLVGQRCEVRLTATTVEVFCQGQRVASHPRSARPGGQTTDPAHRPEAHRRHLECTPAQLRRWAAQTGPATAAVVAGLLAARPHPAPGLRAGLGVVRLGGRYGAGRLEAACRRALALQTLSYRSIESILQTGLDRQPLPPLPAPGPGPPPAPPRRAHPNVRGAPYYH
jgi:transposase